MEPIEPNQPQSPAQDPVAKNPADDQGSIQVDGFIRITDPNTNEVILETRA